MLINSKRIFYLYFVRYYIYLNFFVVIAKMRTSMMSYIKEYMGQLTRVSKILAWMHSCLWLILNQGKKNKRNYSGKKNLFKISKTKKRNFIAPLYRWGSTASSLEPLRGGSLLFTTKFPEIPELILSTLEGWTWFFCHHS